MDIAHEMSVMVACVQIQALVAFVDVNQGNDVRPPGFVDCSHMRDFLTTKKAQRVTIAHQTLLTMHVTARIGYRRSRITHKCSPLLLPALS